MISLIDLGTWQTFAVVVTFRTTLVLTTASVACVLMRKSSASSRHLVWTLAVTGALAMPLLALALPAWRLPVLPAAERAIAPADRIEPSSIPFEAETNSGRPIIESEVASYQADAGPTAKSEIKPKSRSRSWAAWATVIWAAVAVAVMIPLFVGQARLWLIERRSLRVDRSPWTELADRLRTSLGLSRPVALLQGESAASPMTWGVLRPKILLPVGAEDWPDDRLHDVLLHELAHVQRWDCLSQILARLACAVYWFHPLAWLASYRLQVERELACDDLVLQSGSKATDYAGHLLDLARCFRPSPGLATAAVPMARASQIERRLKAILDGSRCRRALSRRAALLMVALSAAVVLPLSAARLVGATTEQKGEAGVGVRSAAMTVSGRVLDPDGKPVANADVVIVGRRKLAALNARSEGQHEALGHTTTDAQGRFRLDVQRTSSLTHYESYAFALAPGFGLGWTEFNRDAESPSTDVKLKPEQIVEGRLADSKGAPAAGVGLHVSTIGVVKKEVGGFDGLNLAKEVPDGMKTVWPKAAPTDADGRFRLTGVGRGVQVRFRTEDPRFARQGFQVMTDAAEGPKQATLTLRQAMPVSGRVTCADTGKPIRDAIVAVVSGSDRDLLGGEDQYRTDADGRYKANPTTGKYLQVTVYPPVGSPYLIYGRKFEGEDETAARVADLAVPRGVLVTGRITERSTGRPLSGASVLYENGGTNVIEKEGTIPGWMAAVSSGANGRYAIAVTPGKGHLLVYGATADFVHEMKGGRELQNGKPGGERHYAHAFVPYEAKPGPGSLPIDVTLRPGITVAGRVVGPEGQAIDKAEIITTLSISPFHHSWRGDFTIPVREGRFELHGVSPDRSVKCSFLDAENGWGTTIEVDAAMASGGPLTVKLEKCGTAKARLVDEKGNPHEKGVLIPEILGNPGPGTNYGGESLTPEEKGLLLADQAYIANVDRRNYWQAPRSDARGLIALPYLIPGATYRIYEYTPDRGKNAFRWRDFTLGSGQSLDLGDVRKKTSDN